MDRSDIRRAIERPRAERLRVRLGDIGRLYPRRAGQPVASEERTSSVPRRGSAVVLAIVGIVAAIGSIVALAIGRALRRVD